MQSFFYPRHLSFSRTPFSSHGLALPSVVLNIDLSFHSRPEPWLCNVVLCPHAFIHAIPLPRTPRSPLNFYNIPNLQSIHERSSSNSNWEYVSRTHHLLKKNSVFLLVIAQNLWHYSSHDHTVTSLCAHCHCKMGLNSVGAAITKIPWAGWLQR